MTDWEEVHRHLQPKMPLYCPETPSLKQKVFLRSNALEALYGGAASGGKSSALLMAGLQYVDIPGYAGIFFRKSYADLALPKALMDRFLEWIKNYDEVKWNPSIYTATFPSGARLTFGYLNNKEDFLRYKCHAAETDVLTSRGWKPIGEVRVGDKVLSINPETRKLSFETVEHTYEYDWNGPLVTTQEGGDVSFAITPNHTCWTSTQRNNKLKPVLAEDLPARPFFPQVGTWVGGVRPSVPLHQYWQNLSEGGRIKKIPREVFGFDAGACTFLLHSLLDTYGTWRDKDRKSGHFVATTKRLADDVMELATRCGYRATLNRQHYSETHGYVPKGASFHVFLLKKDKDTATWVCALDTYRGKVYGIDVPPHHTHLIRHNGRVSYTGNSSEFQFVGMDEVTEIREHDYVYMFSRLRRPPSGPLSEVPLRMRCASNPAPNWVRQRFIVEGKEAGRIFVPAFLGDNPGIEVDSYRRSLQELGYAERRALEFGDWWVSQPGSMFKAEDFGKFVSSELPTFDRPPKMVRYWDLAATEEPDPTQQSKDPDYTVGVLAMLDQGICYILDVKRARRDSYGVEKLIEEAAQEDGAGVPIRMEQEPGSSGKSLIDSYARKVLVGYDFEGISSTGEKEVRARPFAAAVRNGNVKLLIAPWNGAYLEELAAFDPERKTHAHDDQVDASTGAFNYLAGYGFKKRGKVTIIV